MHRYLIVIEKAESNYSAYAPDLPGCVATGKTIEETEKNMREALEMHIAGIIEDEQEVPEPRAVSEHISVAAS